MYNPAHPGEILRETVLVELGLTVNEVASKLGVSRVTLSRVLNKRAGMSANLALRLEAAGISTAETWLSIQSAYDLAQLRNSSAKQPTVQKLVACA